MKLLFHRSGPEPFPGQVLSLLPQESSGSGWPEQRRRSASIPGPQGALRTLLLLETAGFGFRRDFRISSILDTFTVSEKYQ